MQPRVQTRTSPIGHLPLIRAVAERLGILSCIDGLLPKPTRARVSDAECVLAMVLNILSGRVALYAMERWLAHTDTELLIGAGCEPDAFNDTRLGETLDRLDQLGSDRVMGAIVEHYLCDEARPTEYTVHTDTTSFSLYGAYLDAPGPEVTFGFSKDKRPDLKQLVFGLTLHGAAGIPLLADVVAGNTPDSEVNRDVLRRLSVLLPAEDDVTVVADCKAVDAVTVGRALDEGLHLLSLLPDTYGARGRWITGAWEACPSTRDWPVLAEEPGRLKADPRRQYRGWSVVAPFQVERRRGGTVARETQDMRYLVVHSSALEAKFDKRLDDRLERERDKVAAWEKRIANEGYACEADARTAAEKEAGKLALHTAEVQVDLVVTTLRRPRPGRPRNGESAPTHEKWVPRLALAVDRAAVLAARQRKSCFVLITDHVDEEAWPDERILREYRQQFLVENHTGFRWLKSEAGVAPMFLNTPTRIRALGLVFVLALMIRNYIQFTLRAELERTGETLPHPFTNKEVGNLTTEMAMQHFMGVQTLELALDDTPFVRQPPTLTPQAVRILELLRVSPRCFVVPPLRHGPGPP